MRPFGDPQRSVWQYRLGRTEELPVLAGLGDGIFCGKRTIYPFCGTIRLRRGIDTRPSRLPAGNVRSMPDLPARESAGPLIGSVPRPG